MNDAMVFSVNLDGERHAMLQSVCDSLGIILKPVPREAFGLPLGALLGMPAARLAGAAEDSGFDDPMLLLCGLEEPTFSAFLQALRRSGLPRIDLKAVLTPTNVAWTAVQLRNELLREHEQMRRASR